LPLLTRALRRRAAHPIKGFAGRPPRPTWCAPPPLARLRHSLCAPSKEPTDASTQDEESPAGLTRAARRRMGGSHCPRARPTPVARAAPAPRILSTAAAAARVWGGPIRRARHASAPPGPPDQASAKMRSPPCCLAR
jgi:hypothetical protein